jgi:hypothetical protein
LALIRAGGGFDRGYGTKASTQQNEDSKLDESSSFRNNQRFLPFKANRDWRTSMYNREIIAVLLTATALSLSVPTAFAQGGGAGGGGAAGGAAGASSGATGGMSGSAGAGNTSTGIGATTGASSTNTVGQVNKTISPSNPATTEPGGGNALPVPNGTVTEQNAQQFDPRLSPGYQK